MGEMAAGIFIERSWEVGKRKSAFAEAFAKAMAFGESFGGQVGSRNAPK
jgi:hypothetical protein